jgi:hypothetical protein
MSTETSDKPQGLRMAVANGALLEVPVFEAHHRGTNYMAVIDVDGTCPGGLSRKWIDRGKGECFYLIEQLQLFDSVEFAADYTTGMGKRHRKRWYGVVTAKTEDYILAEECKSGVKAVLLSKAKRTDPNALADAFARERDVLLKRAQELAGAIDQLRSGAVTPEDVIVDHNPVPPPSDGATSAVAEQTPAPSESVEPPQ